jgi:hypothetical protein
MLNFLFGKPFGLSINDTAVQVIQLKEKRVISGASKKLESGIVINGEIVKEEALAKVITQLLKTASPHPIKSRSCVMSLPESQSYEHVFKLPLALKNEALKNAIDKKVKEVIPIPFVELKYDFRATPKDANTQNIRVVAVRRIVIAQYYEVLKHFCKLKPLALEPESESLKRQTQSAQGLPAIATGAALRGQSGREEDAMNLFKKEDNLKEKEEGGKEVASKTLNRIEQSFKIKTAFAGMLVLTAFALFTWVMYAYVFSAQTPNNVPFNADLTSESRVPMEMKAPVKKQESATKKKPKIPKNQ